MLKDALHAPSVASNLVSVHKLCRDNNIFIEFHSSFFSVKDTHSRKTLVQGPLDQGLHKLLCGAGSFRTSTSKAPGVSTSFLATASVWHNRLCHVSDPVVDSFLHRYNMDVIKGTSASSSSVCGLCSGQVSQVTFY